jgi:hypothetical protein
MVMWMTTAVLALRAPMKNMKMIPTSATMEIIVRATSRGITTKRYEQCP